MREILEITFYDFTKKLKMEKTLLKENLALKQDFRKSFYPKAFKRSFK